MRTKTTTTNYLQKKKLKQTNSSSSKITQHPSTGEHEVKKKTDPREIKNHALQRLFFMNFFSNDAAKKI